MPTIDMQAIKTEAQNAYVADVAKDLVKKNKVIAKRQSQIDAYMNVLNKQVEEYKAAWNKKLADFENAVTGSTTPAEITAALNSFKFPASSIHFYPAVFTPSQDE